MSLHPAPTGTTAATAVEIAPDLFDDATSMATAGRTWLDPVPLEQVEDLAQNFVKGHFVIAPVLDPAGIEVSAIEETFWVTDQQLERLRLGDTVLANAMTPHLWPVHSVGSVTVNRTHEGAAHQSSGEFQVTFTVKPDKGPAQSADTYEEAVRIATNLAALDPVGPLHVEGRLIGDSGHHLAFVRSTSHEVTTQLAVATYDDGTRIIGFAVVEGTIDLRA